MSPFPPIIHELWLGVEVFLGARFYISTLPAENAEPLLSQIAAVFEGASLWRWIWSVLFIIVRAVVFSGLLRNFPSLAMLSIDASAGAFLAALAERSLDFTQYVNVL